MTTHENEQITGRFYAAEFLLAHLYRLHMTPLDEKARNSLVDDIERRAKSLPVALPDTALSEFLRCVKEILTKAAVDAAE